MARTRYQGVLQILRFNRRSYAQAAATAVVVLACAAAVRPPWRALLATAAAPAIYWSCASLAASHWVYDRSSLYDPAWLSRILSRPPRRWLSLHAGLDEFGGALRAAFPQASACVLDFFDAAEMTEPSIREARRLFPPRDARAGWRRLPVRDAAFDAVFLLFAAHELRRPAARERYFCEVARALRPGGEAIVLEHLRDWRNFAAFGPGFLHFFPERTWLRAAAAAGLETRRSKRVSVFVRLFVFARPL